MGAGGRRVEEGSAHVDDGVGGGCAQSEVDCIFDFPVGCEVVVP